MKLPQKQTICHVLNPCTAGCYILKSNWIPNFLAQLNIAFFSHTLCNSNSCNSTRLCDANNSPIMTKSSTVQKLWQFCKKYIYQPVQESKQRWSRKTIEGSKKEADIGLLVEHFFNIAKLQNNAWGQNESKLIKNPKKSE